MTLKRLGLVLLVAGSVILAGQSFVALREEFTDVQLARLKFYRHHFRGTDETASRVSEEGV